jgi:TonB-linked SusC/RagA family outer membrane protein
MNINMKKMLMLLLMVPLMVLAQDAEIKVDVTIVDESGEVLPGATVKVSGKPIGVITDNQGHVSLWAARGAQLTISYIGMQTRTLKVTRPISGKIVLSDENTSLDQVVVTGYQRTTKRRVTGSVATLSAEELKDKPLANIDMLLQGKIAGVDVKALSGRPGESAKIRIRGTNTITGNAEPLWVVDGVPLQKNIPTISSSQIRAGDFNDIFANGISGINPNDIENVTVLKDASAAAIYGSRAAGGVIVVTTKRGKEGRLSVNYSANLSLTTSPPRDANLMDSGEKLAWEQELWDEFSQPYKEAGKNYPVVGLVGMIRSGYGKYAGMSKEAQDAEIARRAQTTTDWFDQLFRNSLSNSHYLSLSGGSDKSTYYVSLGYSHNSGLVKRTDYDHYNVGTKLDFKPNRRVKVGLSLNASWQKSGASSLGVDPFSYAYFANPYETPYNEDGSYRADETYWELRLINGDNTLQMPANGFNVMREMDNTSNVTKNFDMQAIVNISINFTDNFSFEGMGSYGYVNNMGDNINGRDTYSAWNDRPFEKGNIYSKRTYSSITQSAANNTNYNLRGQLHYFNTFGDVHYFSTLLGTEIRGQYAKSIFEKRYAYDDLSGNSAMPVFPDTGLSYSLSELQDYANIIDGLSGQSITEDRFASFYFSMDYVLMKRYVASLTARTDGSNNFGSNEQFNPTGSLGFSWNVDQEPFMERLKPVVSSLSLRAAFGYTGNINKSVYPQLMMDYSRTYRRTNDDYFRMGSIRNAPNPALRWEKTRDYKFSLDAGLFSDRLHFSAEFYNRRTYDAVSAIIVPYTTGFSTQSYNTSTLENVGMEFSLSAAIVRKRDWGLSMSANIAYNRNKLLKFESPSSGLSSGTHVGYPLGSLFSGKSAGIDPATGVYIYEPRPDAVFASKADYNNSNNYLFYLGTKNAPVNGGYSISGHYKRVSLSLGGSYSFGGKMMNNIVPPVSYQSLNATPLEKIATQQNDLYVNHLNVNRDVVNRWTVSNPRTDGYPRLIDAVQQYLGLDDKTVTISTITQASMLENVSYFKLGSASLSYSFAPEMIRSLLLQSVALSLTVNNLFTITNYSGIDPETPGAVYPLARTFSFGLSVGF